MGTLLHERGISFDQGFDELNLSRISHAEAVAMGQGNVLDREGVEAHQLGRDGVDGHLIGAGQHAVLDDGDHGPRPGAVAGRGAVHERE